MKLTTNTRPNRANRHNKTIDCNAKMYKYYIVSLYEQYKDDFKSDSIKNSDNINVNVNNDYANICNDSIMTNYRNWQTITKKNYGNNENVMRTE